MLKDLLAAGRIANLPTVWTNVLVGAALAGGNWDIGQLTCLALVMLAGSFLYVAGCFYNDYYDRHWDAEHKPERAIPSGRISASLLGWLVLIFAVLGTLVCCSFGLGPGLVALWIIGFIFIYTRIHKRTAFAILPMGACRAGLYFLGFVSMGDVALQPKIIIPALGLISYIAGITLVARSEATNTLPSGAKWFGFLLLSAPIITHSLPISLLTVVYVIGGGALLYLLKVTVEDSVGGFVSLSLAGICVIDGFLLFNLGAEALPVWLNIVIIVAGFLLCRLLQRIAPAT